ncbi:MAG: hypothetical protein JW395_2060 [Nitrospira sp.]|nr:hypothetical protein [Nitrospira sp.]
MFLDLRSLLRRLDIELHLLANPRLRIRRQPNPAQRVLDEVFDDPVGGEELCSSWDIFTRHYLADDRVLPLRDKKLVQPAQDLDFLPVLLVDLLDEFLDERVGGQKVAGQQQLCLVVDPFEQERHCLAQGVALGYEKEPVELLLLGPVEFQFDDLVLVQAREVNPLGMFKNLRLHIACGMAQDPVAMVEIPVQFHEANGHKPVEPRVGDGFHSPLKANARDSFP